MDTAEISVRISRKTREYKEFCKSAGVPEKTSRLRYECGTSDLKKTQAWDRYSLDIKNAKEVQEKLGGYGEKPVADPFRNDTIELEKEDKGIEVHTIGKIDREIYKCITDDIVTDEVIITDERIQHIIQRRGKEFYDRYGDKFKDIVFEPDYIFADKENTALACKRFEKDGKYINIVVRLVVSTDKPTYKNSIITAVGESEKRFNQRLRNKIALYKRE